MSKPRPITVNTYDSTGEMYLRISVAEATSEDKTTKYQIDIATNGNLIFGASMGEKHRQITIRVRELLDAVIPLFLEDLKDELPI